MMRENNGGNEMKFVSFLMEKQERYGVYDEKQQMIFDVKKMDRQKNGYSDLPDHLVEALELGDLFLQKVHTLLDWGRSQIDQQWAFKWEEVELLAPIPRPRKNVICIGKNYRDHAVELGGANAVPEHLIVFSKAPTTVIGHLHPIPAYTDVTEALDYEGELAVIIGKKGKGIKKENALDYVFGYTIINDVTARDLQKRHTQYFLGKSLDFSCPMGPWIITKDEVPEPGNLAIETKVNGEVRQRSNTRHFIFSLEEIIETISRGMTLEPGDVIATGTPAGVGLGFNPPKLLKAGDVVEITVEGIGTLRNQVQ